MKKFVVALAASVILSGCASIIEGSHQSIAIETPPTTGAICSLSSKAGSWPVTSPGTVTVDKSTDDIHIVCKKPGWRDGSAIIPSNFEGWTVGNIVFGGVIGLGVDAATGAINKYPNAFQVTMIPEGPLPPPPPVAAPLALPPPATGKPGV